MPQELGRNADRSPGVKGVMRRRLGLLLIALAVAPSLLVAVAPAASACSCVLTESFSVSDVREGGGLLQAVAVDGTAEGDTIVEVLVERAWDAADATPQMYLDVLTSDGDSCGTRLMPGARVWVGVDEVISLCTPSGVVGTDAAATLDAITGDVEPTSRGPVVQLRRPGIRQELALALAEDADGQLVTAVLPPAGWPVGARMEVLARCPGSDRLTVGRLLGEFNGGDPAPIGVLDPSTMTVQTFTTRSAVNGSPYEHPNWLARTICLDPSGQDVLALFATFESPLVSPTRLMRITNGEAMEVAEGVIWDIGRDDEGLVQAVVDDPPRLVTVDLGSSALIDAGPSPIGAEVRADGLGLPATGLPVAGRTAARDMALVGDPYTRGPADEVLIDLPEPTALTGDPNPVPGLTLTTFDRPTAEPSEPMPAPAATRSPGTDQTDEAVPSITVPWAVALTTAVGVAAALLLRRRRSRGRRGRPG